MSLREQLNFAIYSRMIARGTAHDLSPLSEETDGFGPGDCSISRRGLLPVEATQTKPVEPIQALPVEPSKTVPVEPTQLEPTHPDLP